ncbi:hypothetical protein MT418_008361 [Batrachochytrium dendrobatidis]
MGGLTTHLIPVDHNKASGLTATQLGPGNESSVLADQHQGIPQVMNYPGGTSTPKDRVLDLESACIIYSLEINHR